MTLVTSSLAGLFLVWLCLAIAPSHVLPTGAVRDLVVMIAGPVLLGTALSTRRTLPALPHAVVAALLVLAGLISTAGVPAVERPAVARDALVLVALVLTGLAAARLAGRPDSARSLDAALGTSALTALSLVASVGLVQTWTGWEGLPQSHPPAATFVNRNAAAGALIMLLPLAAGSSAGTRRWLARCGRALAIGLGLALLIATRSRGAWLGAALGWGLALAWMVSTSRRTLPRPTRGLLLPALVAAVPCLLVLALPIRVGTGLPPLGERITSLARPLEGTGSARVALWRNTLAMIGAHPLAGVGAGRFAVEYPRFQMARAPTPWFGLERQPDHVENDALELAAELGLPAALLIGALLAGAVVRHLARARAAGSIVESTQATAAAAALGAALAHGLTSFPLHQPATAYLAALLAGRAWATARDGPARLAWARPLVIGGCAAAALTGAWIGAREWRAQASLGRAAEGHARGDCPAAMAAARSATALAGWRRHDVGLAAMVHYACNTDPTSSLTVLVPALALQPNQLNLLLAVGARSLKAGRAAAAEEAFERAAAIAPALGNGWLGLAMAQDAQGRRPEAAASCARALAQAPAFEPARAYCAGAP